MKKKMMILSSGLVLTGIQLPSLKSQASVLDPIVTAANKMAAPLKEQAPKLLASLNLDASIDLFNAELITGLQLGGKYELQVVPAYQSTDYLRIDTWNPRANLDALAAARIDTSNHIPLSLQLNLQNDVIFISKFKSQSEALKMKHMEWNPKDIPFNSDIADKMPVGNSVIFSAQLGLTTGALTPQIGSVNSVIEPYLTAGFFIKGQFQVQVTKIDAARVRVRLVSIKTEGAAAEGGASLFYDGWSVVGNSLIGKRIFVTNAEKDNVAAVVMSDHIFNFHTSDEASNAETRKLYDDLLSPRLRLPARASLNLLSSTTALQGLFISDLGSVERAARAAIEKNTPLENRGIIRVFNGVQKGRPEGWSLKLGLNPINFKSSQRLDNAKQIDFVDTDQKSVKYAVPTVSSYLGFDALFGWKHDEFKRSSSLIMPINEQGQITDQADGKHGIGDFVLTVQSKNSTLHEDYKDNLLRFAHRQLSPEIVAAIHLDESVPNHIYQNARTFARIIIKQPAFNYISSLTYDQMKMGLEDYLRINADNLPGKSAAERAQWPSEHRADLDKMVYVLHDLTTNPNYSNKTRIQRFMKMQYNGSELSLLGFGDALSRTFHEVGSGYLISLLPKDQLANLVDVNISVDSTAFHGTLYLPEFGQSDSSGISQVVEYINNLIEKGGYDVRLETYGKISAVSGQVISVEAIRKMTRSQ
jgi:hypothetical protein